MNAMKSQKILTSLAIAAFFIAALLFFWARLSASLLPPANSDIGWSAVPSSDTDVGGTSQLLLQESKKYLAFEFKLDQRYTYPYASLGLVFNDGKQMNTLRNLSRYSTLRIALRCKPANDLNFVLYSVDEPLTAATEFQNLRPSLTSFPCGEELEQVDINLSALVTQEWWLSERGLPPTDTAYNLKQVFSVALVNSRQSPLGQPVRVEVTQLLFRGWHPQRLAAALASLVLASAMLVFLIYHRYLGRLLKPIETHIEPATSYQPLKVTAKKDRDKHAVLQYLAKEYTHPNLSLQQVMQQLGINRTKLNHILKEETGLTFSSYLNHLRLTEAARLLLEKDTASVAEIAYSVGYNNASYFNRIFKSEYGCAPTAYRKRETDKQEEQE